MVHPLYLSLLLLIALTSMASAFSHFAAIKTIIERCKFVITWKDIDMQKIYTEDRGVLKRMAGINIIDVRHAAMLKMRLNQLREDISSGVVNMASYLEDGLQCIEEEQRKQTHLELKYIGTSSSCAGLEAYKIAQMVWPQASVFIDVGCNRGFMSSLFYSLWGGGGYEISPYTIGQIYDKNAFFPKHANPWGLCKTAINRAYPLYCPDTSLRERDGKCLAKNANFKMYSIDGSSFIVKSLNRLIDEFLGTGLNWKTVQLAINDVEGTADFELQNEKLKPGSEGSKIITPEDIVIKVGSPPLRTEKVRMGTLASFIAQEGLERVDVIKIDAEGYDTEAVQGAMSILNSAQVGMIVFEKNAKKARQVYQTISDLENMHFDCYTPHFFGMLKLTGKCYTTKGASVTGNVFCASRKYAPEVVIAYDALSMYNLDDYYEQYEKFERSSHQL